MRVAPALAAGKLAENFNRVRPSLSRDTVKNINLGISRGMRSPRDTSPSRQGIRSPRDTSPSRQGIRSPQDTSPSRRGLPMPAPAMPVPPMPRALKAPDLLHPVQSGQKTRLNVMQGDRTQLRVAFGWNVRDARCDVDASAFLLGSNNRVPSDDWFVFYSQPVSPDGSVRFQEDGRTEREIISVDFSRVDARIQRIVFVMSINEAKEKQLNFGKIDDAWLRVLDGSGREVLSYRPRDFYESITSMTLGEIYLRGGEWRFNPVGRGLDIDLAGQCAVYGVNISD